MELHLSEKTLLYKREWTLVKYLTLSKQHPDIEYNQQLSIGALQSCKRSDNFESEERLIEMIRPWNNPPCTIQQQTLSELLSDCIKVKGAK